MTDPKWHCRKHPTHDPNCTACRWVEHEFRLRDFQTEADKSERALWHQRLESGRVRAGLTRARPERPRDRETPKRELEPWAEAMAEAAKIRLGLTPSKTDAETD